jgi:rare lipoprotein A (peptidoglycan hydrolase)
VTAAAARRIASLAAVGVLAAALTVYLSHRHHHHSTLPAPAGPWMTALAAAYEPTHRTACGVHVGPNTVGVGHPVLPCGVKLYLRFGDRTVLTTVIDRGEVPPGRELDLTPKIAELLGVEGTQRIRWRFTR